MHGPWDDVRHLLEGLLDKSGMELFFIGFGCYMLATVIAGGRNSVISGVYGRADSVEAWAAAGARPLRVCGARWWRRR